MPASAATFAPAASRIEARYKSSEKKTVETAIWIGEVYESTRGKLGRMEFGRWTLTICIPKQTAQRYRDVYRLHLESPLLVRRLAHLGMTRLARLSRVPPEHRTAALSALSSPGVCAMSSAEFREYTRPFLKVRQDRPVDPVAQIVKSVASLQTKIQTAIAALPREAIAAIVVALQPVCAMKDALSKHLRPTVHAPGKPSRPTRPPVADPEPTPVIPSPIEEVPDSSQAPTTTTEPATSYVAPVTTQPTAPPTTVASGGRLPLAASRTGRAKGTVGKN